jgi:hypothetical protein
VGKTFECCDIKMISQLNRATSLRRKLTLQSVQSLIP